MKVNKTLKDYFFTIVFILFVIGSHFYKIDIGIALKDKFLEFFVEMIIFLPLMFILIGLFDVWVPREKIEKHIGEDSGIKGTALIVLLAMLQAGPLYGAFPVSYLLWKKGCSIKNIFVYLGAFSTLKIPMLTFEMGFMGVKFSLLRTLITLPVFILIAEVMSAYLKDKTFEVKAPETKKAQAEIK